MCACGVCIRMHHMIKIASANSTNQMNRANLSSITSIWEKLITFVCLLIPLVVFLFCGINITYYWTQRWISLTGVVCACEEVWRSQAQPSQLKRMSTVSHTFTCFCCYYSDERHETIATTQFENAVTVGCYYIYIVKCNSFWRSKRIKDAHRSFSLFHFYILSSFSFNINLYIIHILASHSDNDWIHYSVLMVFFIRSSNSIDFLSICALTLRCILSFFH